MSMLIFAGDYPGYKLKAKLGQLSEDIINEDLEFTVDANYCRVEQVDEIAKALVGLSMPNWGLRLRFEYIGLESVPDSVWELTNLEHLWLNDNCLRTISPAIAKLTKLQWLYIGDNPLECFPEGVCKLEQLKKLWAYRCQFSVLPSSFASLRNLLDLDLSRNAFEEFPEVICELRNLRRLVLDENKLSSLPQSFANLRELRELYVEENCFKEFPLVVCELSNLEDLWADRNELSELPLAITKLVNLTSLCLSGNSFTSFPLFVGDLPRLSAFAWGGNPLQGLQRDFTYYSLLPFFHHRKETARLSAIIAGGFFAPDDKNPWTQFLVRGLYDPRLFIFIFDFAMNVAVFEPFGSTDSQKRGRYE